MSKTVKLEDQVYTRLDDFRDKHETFSEAVERLLRARDDMCRLVDVLEGQIRFKEWQREQLEKTPAANR